MFTLRRFIKALAVLILLVPALALAATVKKYQVTGKVLEATDTMIVVEKGSERWELQRDKDTKVEGPLKVGDKVTVQYRCIATDVEVKEKPAK